MEYLILILIPISKTLYILVIKLTNSEILEFFEVSIRIDIFLGQNYKTLTLLVSVGQTLHIGIEQNYWKWDLEQGTEFENRVQNFKPCLKYSIQIPTPKYLFRIQFRISECLKFENYGMEYPLIPTSGNCCLSKKGCNLKNFRILSNKKSLYSLKKCLKKIKIHNYLYTNYNYLYTISVVFGKKFNTFLALPA